jgi:tetratricopeptide (TPR) repeat protein
LRGDFALARSLYERELGRDAASFGKQEAWWPMAASGYVETLVELGDFEQARAVGLASLRFCEARGIGVLSYGISRALALAEAKLGDYGAAAKRLEQVISDQRRRGVTGLQIGATCEARARIAIWASDAPAIEVFARLAAIEYRYGKNSPLGARYERLMNEARRFALGVLPQLPDLSSSRHDPTVPLHTQMVSRDSDDPATTHVEGDACSEANVETIAAVVGR